MPTRVIAISHSTGAGGEAVGRTVAAQLGFRYIDEEIITLAADKEGFDPAVVADAERRKGFLARLFSGPPVMDASGSGFVTPEAVIASRSAELIPALLVEAIRDTAERGQTVIVSHAASIPLAGRADVLRVLVTASFDTRVQRVAGEHRGGAAAAVRLVRDSDAGRADYFQRFYRIDRELPTHYDVVVNTDMLTADEAADIVVAATHRRA